MEHPAWEQEIIDLHVFFCTWLNGSLPAEQAVFGRFADTLAEGFAIITPDGELIEGPALIEKLWALHGRRPGLQIRIERPVLRRRAAGLTLVTYEEWQQIGKIGTTRISTALFVDAPAAPNGLHWAHVHETWLQPYPDEEESHG